LKQLLATKKKEVKQILAQNKDKSEYNVKELKLPVAYKKQPGDPKMPSKKKDLFETYLKYYEGPLARPSPQTTPEPSDDENDDAEDLDDLITQDSQLVVEKRFCLAEV